MISPSFHAPGEGRQGSGFALVVQTPTSIAKPRRGTSQGNQSIQFRKPPVSSTGIKVRVVAVRLDR